MVFEVDRHQIYLIRSKQPQTENISEMGFELAEELERTQSKDPGARGVANTFFKMKRKTATPTKI